MNMDVYWRVTLIFFLLQVNKKCLFHDSCLIVFRHHPKSQTGSSLIQQKGPIKISALMLFWWVSAYQATLSVNVLWRVTIPMIRAASKTPHHFQDAEPQNSQMGWDFMGCQRVAEKPVASIWWVSPTNPWVFLLNMILLRYFGDTTI